MAFPSTLSSFNRPNATDRLNSPSHSALHNTVSSALGQVEAVIGVDGDSSVVGTMMYDIRSNASKGGGHVQGAAFGGTGQTTFTKGDILVAQSASVLSKLAIGTNGYLLSVNSTQATGTQWVPNTASSLGIATPVVRVYTVSSVAGWTKPSLLSHIIVEVVSGGAGGGTGNSGAGGGGGGGGYARKLILPSVLQLSESILIGAGGASATAGGTSGFGVPSILYATGAAPGANGTNAAVAAGGGGGLGTLGDLNVGGGGGGVGGEYVNGIYQGGTGGSSPFGGGGGGASADAVGGTGRQYGGGGGGGGGSNTGGAGFDGVVIVTEYYI